MRAAALAVLALVLAAPCRAAPTQLVYTVPSTGQLRYTVPGDGQDSVHVECDGGPPARVLKTFLYGLRISGGLFAVVDSHGVQGLEGMEDAYPIPFPGHFYVRAWNTAGTSCAGSTAYVPPPDPTSVPTDSLAAPQGPCALLSVQGRKVATLDPGAWDRARLRPLNPPGFPAWVASGVYWVVRGSDSACESRRVVVVR